MDHGNTPSGCSKGKDCEKAHVTLCLESLEHKVCSSSIEGKRCHYGYHLKGTKVIGKQGEAPSEGSGGKPKSNSKASKKTTHEIETVEEEDGSDSTKEVMKSFFISVVNLVSGLTAGKKKAREKKKKQDQNKELLKSLANLLG